MKKFRNVLLVLLVALGSLFAQPITEKQNSVVVLYTNDVHCAIRSSLGYESLVALKQEVLKKTPYVVLVDNGDSIQGEAMGTISKGEYPVEIMNKVGYDYAAIGNHEFDYGMDRLSQLIGKADCQYLACNIKYTGSKGNLLGDVKPYEVVT